MRYWAYIDKKVCGPFEQEKLAGLPDFGPALLLCPDIPGGAQADAWKEASAYPEVLTAVSAAPAPAQPARPAAENPIGLTMRGSLIGEPVTESPAPAPARPAQPAAESPLLMTMRGTLIEEPGVGEPVKAPPAASPAAAANSAAPEPLKLKLEQAGAELAAIAETQSQLAARLKRLESAVADMKALLPGAAQKK